MSDSQTIVDIDHLSFGYPPKPAENLVLEDISLQIAKNEFLGIIGPNGGGKTTLLKIMLGLLPAQQGRVSIFGQPVHKVRNRIGYVPQHAKFDTSVPANVMDVVLMGRLSKSPWGPSFSRDDREAAMAALEDTQTAEFAKRPIGSLSGGQRQRVLIARAMVCGAELLLLDEPTVGIDAQAEKQLFDLLHRFNERMPLVMVSHDVTYVSTHFTRVACLNRRVSCHHAAELSGKVISDMYRGDLRLIAHEDDEDCPVHGHAHVSVPDHSHDHDSDESITQG
jgi:zinc transport system ATP-binding protein